MSSWRCMLSAASPADLRREATPSFLPEPNAGNPADKDLQRAEGSCRIVLSGSERGTRIMDVFQQSPIRVLFPGTRGAAVEEAVFVNTGGGIAGGGRLAEYVE